MSRYRISILMATTIVVSLIALMAPVDQAATLGTLTDDAGDTIEWALYIDPVLDFSIEYPANWIVNTPHLDNRGVGSTLSFVENSSSHDREGNHIDFHLSPLKVEIGTYLTEPDHNYSLAEWTIMYENMSQVVEQSTVESWALNNLTVDSYPALQVIGASPLTNFKVTNIQRDNIIWFIWSNANDVDANIYDYMISSFRFGKASPRSLQQLYGDKFQPFPLNHRSNTASNPFSWRTNVARSFATSLGSWWHAPLAGSNLTASCNSSAHNTSRSKYAIDVARPEGTLIYASDSAPVSFAGWDINGFGNLVITTGGAKAYYAHMSVINWETIIIGNWYVYRGDNLGEVGNTGNSSNNHLHFEVRYLNNDSRRLNGMTGFSPASENYEYPHNPCGSITYP